MKRVSINILNYNGKKFIKECIEGCLKQDYPNYEVVFIDNNSKDGSIDYLRENYPTFIKQKKIKILSLSKNKGFAGGYNEAYKINKSEYFLLLNNDVKITDRTLVSKLVHSIESSKDIGSVGCVDLPFNQGLKDLPSAIKGGISVIQTNIFDNKSRQEVFYAGGVCCLVRRRNIKQLFEEEYFAYAEDVYLGFKLRMEGKKNIYNYKTYLLHHGAGTSGRGSTLTRYHGEKNRIRNLIYFYEKKTLLKVLPIFIIHLIFSYFFYLIRPKILLATIRAHINVIFNIRKILKKRKIFQKSRVIEDEELLRFMSAYPFSKNVGNTSYKILKNNLFNKVYSMTTETINEISKGYCSLVGIKTREFFNDER